METGVRRASIQVFIEKAAEKAELTDREQVIRALVEKRMRNRDEVTEKDIRKLEAYLARRGFYGEEIWKVLKRLQVSCAGKNDGINRPLWLDIITKII